MAEGGREENDKHIPQFSARRQKYEEEEETSLDYKKKIRIILVGKTGNGKSAVGNSILGYEGFTSDLSPSSTTQKGDIKQMIWDDDTVIEVVDTPGFFDTEKSVEKVALEIIQSFGMIAPGPEVILYVLNCDAKFTDEEENTLKDFDKIFTGDAKRFMIICFTRKDALQGKSPEKFLLDIPKWTNDFLVTVDNRKFFIDNTLTEKDKQMYQWIELYNIVKQMLKKNEGGHYTNEILRDVTEQMKLKITEADTNLSIFRRKFAMLKRNIACQGSSPDYWTAGLVGGVSGVTVGAVIGGFFFANPILGAIVGGAGGPMSTVAKAVIRIRRKKEGYRYFFNSIIRYFKQ